MQKSGKSTLVIKKYPQNFVDPSKKRNFAYEMVR